MISLYRSCSTPGTSAPAWRRIEVTGADAQDLLHRVTSADVRGLGLGRGIPAFFLTPQGKIRVYFTLWSLGPGEYALELDAGRDGRWQSALLTAIDQYTFAEKISVKPSSGFESLWIFFESDDELGRILQGLGAETPGCAEFGTLPLPGGGRIFHHGNRDFGKGWLTLWTPEGELNSLSDRLRAVGTEVALDTIEGWRIHALRPRVDHELTDAALPLEIGLADGISSNKGCYPGQEVIEKILSLGEPPRRLVLIEGELPAPDRGTAVLAAGLESRSEIGHVTSVIQEAGRFVALAVIRKTQARENTEVAFAGDLSGGKVIRIAPYESGP